MFVKCINLIIGNESSETSPTAEAQYFLLLICFFNLYANPYSQLYESLLNTAFEKHTYKHTTMGFFEDIVDMPNQFEYSKEFFNRYYRPEYSTIIVVGDVKPEKVEKLAEKYFRYWKHGDYVSEFH